MFALVCGSWGPRCGGMSNCELGACVGSSRTGFLVSASAARRGEAYLTGSERLDVGER